MNFQVPSIAVNLVVLFVMKVISQLTSFQYSIYNSNEYHEANGTCQLKEPKDLTDVVNSPIMAMSTQFNAGYLLSAVGGLVASKWLGFQTVLSIGGAVMTLAIGLMAASIWFGLICNQGFYVFVWIFHPLYMGLVLPCLLYGFFRWASGPRSRLLIAVLYNNCAMPSPWIILFTLPIIKERVQQHSYGTAVAVVLGLSLLFITLSTTLAKDDRSHPFEPPTLGRLIRYFRIVTVYTLFAAQLFDGHVDEYRQEILLYSNSTNFSQPELDLLQVMTKTNIPRLVSNSFIPVTSIALVLPGVFKCIRFVSHEHRFQIGIAIAAAVAMACFVANLILSRFEASSPILTTAVFCTAAILDGVAEAVTMTALYEFVDSISQRGHKVLLFGIALSISSLANLIQFGLRFLTIDVIQKAVSGGEVYRHSATHAMSFLLLVACLVYCRYVSFPLAFTLVQDQADDSADDDEEQYPLLDPISSDQI